MPHWRPPPAQCQGQAEPRRHLEVGKHKYATLEIKQDHLPGLVHEAPLVTGRQPQAGAAPQPEPSAPEKTKTAKIREKIRICKLELDANHFL